MSRSPIWPNSLHLHSALSVLHRPSSCVSLLLEIAQNHGALFLRVYESYLRHLISSQTRHVLIPLPHRSIQQVSSRRLLSLNRGDILHWCECGECLISRWNLRGEMRSCCCCGMCSQSFSNILSSFSDPGRCLYSFERHVREDGCDCTGKWLQERYYGCVKRLVIISIGAVQTLRVKSDVVDGRGCI
jgi:hypothetical protein